MADDTSTRPDNPERRSSPRSERQAIRRGTERVGVYEEESDDLFRDLPATIKRISWGAIFAGAVVALVTQLALNLLGASIGLAAVDPAAEANPFSGIGIGAGIWLIVSTIAALFTGGYVASRLAGMPDRTDGILHSIVTWSVVTLFAVYFMTSAVGTVLNTATGLIGQTVTAVAPVVSQEVQQQLQQEGVSLDALVSDVIDQAQQQIGNDPGTAAGNDTELSQAIQALAEPGNDAADRQALIDLLRARTNMTEAEARQQVQQYEQQFEQARQQAQQVQQQAVQIGDRAAATLSSAALWAFIAMVVGVLAAVAGGVVGVPRDLPASPSLQRE